MTNEVNEYKEFEILDQKIRFKPSSADEVQANEIVELVQKEISAITKEGKVFGSSRIALLVALKIAGDKIKLENEYQGNLNNLQGSIDDAINFIDKFNFSSENEASLN